MAFGVDDHGSAAGLGGVDGGPCHRLVTHTLAVVRDKHEVDRRGGLPDPLDEGGANAGVVEQGLLVETGNLVVAGEQPGLDRGRQGAGCDERSAGHTVGLEHHTQLPGGIVSTDGAYQRRRAPHRGNVDGHVGSTTGAVKGSLHEEDRHRRLGRDAVHRSGEVPIEHHVADDQDTGCCSLVARRGRRAGGGLD